MAEPGALADWVRDLPRPAVGCVIVKVIGSAPQGVGARMWVTADAFLGTLGGGRFELEVLEHARALLRSASGAAVLKEYVLCREMGQCCGGRVQVFFEPVAARRRITLFGGGHVGRALAHVLSGMPFDTVVVDPRPEWSSREGLPDDVRARFADPLSVLRSRAWNADDAVCIFTHSHELDFQLAAGLLAHPIGYLGLIGSRHKSEVFRARLLSLPNGAELSAAWDQRMHCPIGQGPESKSPKIIAVSIAAELLKEWAPSQAPESAAAADPTELREVR